MKRDEQADFPLHISRGIGQEDSMISNRVLSDRQSAIAPKTAQRPDPTKVSERCYAMRTNKTCVGVIHADAKLGLSLLPNDCFNVAVTSPPYFWVRDYGYQGQIGHEASVEAYVNSLCDVFDEVKRALHPEGAFFLNIGDTYYSGNGQPHGQDPKCSSRNFLRTKLRPVDQSGWDIPKKSMIGIPWKIAFEMQARGWTLRSDIVWNRVNAFVEPTARDRPHRQYEHIFMFTKSRFYSFDRMSLPEQDVWSIPIERNTKIDHNARYPKELVRRCIVAASPPGGKVLDPFVGSGTTLEVAINEGRHAVGIDLGEKYVAYIMGQLSARPNSTLTQWKSFLTVLRRDSNMWSKWRGNLRNFRKPGTSKKTAKVL
jgi:DNA modification methylase